MKKLFVTLCALFLFSAQLIAQDVYQINWTLAGIRYQAAVIVFNNSYGSARVKYVNDGERNMVEESLSYKTTDNGFNLYGSKPVYPGTGIEYPHYTADEFRVSVRSDGSLYVFFTESGLSLRMQPFGTSIQKITSKSDQIVFLRMFDWRL